MSKTFHVDPRPGIIVRWVVLVVIAVSGILWLDWQNSVRLQGAMNKCGVITAETQASLKELKKNILPIKQVQINSDHLDKVEEDFRALRKSIQQLNHTVDLLRKAIDEQNG